MKSDYCFLRAVVGAAVGLSLLAGAAAHAQAAPQQAAPQQATPQEGAEARQAGESPVLVELFLSQACPMCPAAAALFPEIAAREDVVALAWHIDYWNMTSSPNGSWADPYSQSAFTERQKRYNKNIRHKTSIYTPQVVVGGEAETVGGKREKIDALIEAAPQARAAVSTSLSNGAMMFEIEASENGGNAYLITFKKSTLTRVTGGYNKGEVFEEAHVVTGMRRLGLVRKRGGEIVIDKPAGEEACALIVQEPGQNRVVAAAYCPV